MQKASLLYMAAAALIFCTNYLGASYIIYQGDQFDRIQHDLAQYRQQIFEKNHLPKIDELEQIVHRINGYVAAHAMGIRDEFGPKAANAIFQMRETMKQYRELAKNSELSQKIVAMIELLSAEWAAYKNQVRGAGLLYGQFFECANAVVQKINRKIVERYLG